MEADTVLGVRRLLRGPAPGSRELGRGRHAACTKGRPGSHSDSRFLNTWVEARFPDGGKPDWQRVVTPRQALAEWIARGDNPWFVRAAVNRLWHYFNGIGLIDPVDGLGIEDNRPSHPELFDELVRQFVAHDFDVKFLIRAIAGSQTYQRSSCQTLVGSADFSPFSFADRVKPAPRAPRQSEPRLFARAVVRGLTPEQLYDSLVLATGYHPDRTKGAPDSSRAEFLAPFDDPNNQPADFQASIQQALMMMNGKFTAEATSFFPERDRGGGSLKARGPWRGASRSSTWLRSRAHRGPRRCSASWTTQRPATAKRRYATSFGRCSTARNSFLIINGVSSQW